MNIQAQGPRDIERGNPDDAERINTNNAPETEAEDERDAVKGSVVREAPEQDEQPKVAPSKNPGGQHAA